MPPSRRRLLLWLWAVATSLFLIRLFAAGVHGALDSAPPLARPTKIDLNRAPVPELVALPGIGRQRAKAIVLHRVRHGPFLRLSDLLEVDGIGPATLEGLRSQLLPLPGELEDRDRLP